MEINLNSNAGMRPEMLDAKAVDAGQETPKASQVSRQTSNLTIGEGVAGLASAEPTADVPESALARDDALGKLVASAFSFPPPEMPSFNEIE